MNLPISALVRSLFDKESLEACSEEELRSLVEKYPYYAPVQILLTEKLKYTGQADYEPALQKTSLFFQNPVWFNYLISDELSSFSVRVDDSPRQASIQAEPVLNESLEIALAEAAPAEPPVLESEIPEPTPPESIVEVQSAIVEEPSVAEPETESVVEETDLAEAKPPQEVVEAPTPSEEIPATVNELVPAQEVEASDGSEAQSDREEKIEVSAEIPERQLPGLETLKIEKLETDANLPAFEPLFTVDYFASQGIKAPENDKANDRFGKQLRSFTEWLKTMKKLSAAEIEKTVVAGSEENVINLAQVSNNASDVLTETMAEVWVKQGNRQKAREIYDKLSLQNPDKSAYFAAKIDALK